MSLAGAACVVSSMVYGREVTDGVNALVADSAEQLTDALSRLIEDDKLRRRIRRNARRTVMAEHSLQTQWWRWLEAYSVIVQNFASKPRIALPA
jgi:glycosyltransferase involved in cell wall biosynthesis